MRRTLVLCLLVIGAAVALAIGSYSALADAGPVTSVTSAVIGADEPDDGDDGSVMNDADDDGHDVDVQDDDGDEVDGDDDGDTGEGVQRIAEVIAEEFGDSEEDGEEDVAEDVLALHEQGIGFGAIFKLYALAAAMGTSVDDLLATIATDGDGGYEFGFGELRKALTEEQQEVLESGPKNLGQLISASHRAEDAGAAETAGSDAADEAASAGLEKAREKFAAHESNGHGPPESVPAHGRR